MEAVFEAWRQRTEAFGPEFVWTKRMWLGLGELDHWATNRNRRIVATSSTAPPIETSSPGGNHWRHIRLGTLSFHKYLRAKRIDVLPLPKIKSLAELFAWPPTDFQRVRDLGRPYIGHFHEYLVRGGFPQTARVESIAAGQRIVREDCIDKTIRRDIAFQFGVRRVSELEYASLHLCMQDDVLLDLVALCEKLQIKRPPGGAFP